MLVIKGNLIIESEDKLRIAPILRQALNSSYSKTSLELINDIVAYADLTLYDITDATVLEGDVELTYSDLDNLTLVTGNVVEGGSYGTT